MIFRFVFDTSEWWSNLAILFQYIQKKSEVNFFAAFEPELLRYQSNLPFLSCTLMIIFECLLLKIRTGKKVLTFRLRLIYDFGKD